MNNSGHQGFGIARAVVVEQTQSGGKTAALVSLDFGDGGEPVAVVLLAARAEGVRIAELFQNETGSLPPLVRGLNAYGRALDAITGEAARSRADVPDGATLQARFDGRAVNVSGAR